MLVHIAIPLFLFNCWLSQGHAFLHLPSKLLRRTGTITLMQDSPSGRVLSCSIPNHRTEYTSELYNSLFCRVLGNKDNNLAQFLIFEPTELSHGTKSIDVDETHQSYAGIGLGFSQPETLIESLISAGCEIQSPLNDYKFGATMHPEEDDMKTTDVRYATLVDKNGYIIEVVDSFDVDGEPAGGALTRLILYVEDLDESIDFYTNVLGMNLLRKRSNINNTPKDASMVAHVGFGAEGEGVCIELKYRYGTDKISHRPYPCTLSVSVPSIEKVHKIVEKREKVHNGTLLTLLDPSGYKVHIYDGSHNVKEVLK